MTRSCLTSRTNAVLCRFLFTFLHFCNEKCFAVKYALNLIHSVIDFYLTPEKVTCLFSTKKPIVILYLDQLLHKYLDETPPCCGLFLSGLTTFNPDELRNRIRLKSAIRCEQCSSNSMQFLSFVIFCFSLVLDRMWVKKTFGLCNMINTHSRTQVKMKDVKRGFTIEV